MQMKLSIPALITISLIAAACSAQTKMPDLFLKQEMPRLANAPKLKSVEEINQSIASEIVAIQQCSGIKTKISKILLLTNKDWRKLSHSMSGVPNSKVLVIYGIAKKKQQRIAKEDIAPSATVDDFRHLIGKPVCVDDPDEDND